jgi:hypothetical protein
VRTGTQRYHDDDCSPVSDKIKCQFNGGREALHRLSLGFQNNSWQGTVKRMYAIRWKKKSPHYGDNSRG